MVKAFEISVDAPPSPKGHVSGSKVTGRVVVENDEAKSYRQIQISLAGSGKVEWTAGSGEESETHRAREEYLNETATLWEDEGESGSLPAGRHEFPFAFSLPESCPSSYETEGGSSNLDAWIRYVLTGRISTRGALKADHTLEKRVMVFKEVHLEQASFEPTRRVVQGSEGCLCCVSGPVTMTVALSRSSFSQGEGIPLSIELENASSRDLRPEATLVKRARLKARGHTLKPPPQVVMREKCSKSFTARSTSSWSCETPAVPEGHSTMEAPGGMITVSYEVTVHVGLGLGQRLEVCFPVTIGDSVITDVGHTPATSAEGRTVTTDQYQPWNT
jgi:hypothetical protein